MAIKNLINNIRIIKRGDFVKVFSLTSVSTLVKMATGFVTIKFVAILIGPSGVAMLGQLQNFTQLTLLFSTGGINNGVTKYVSENKSDKSAIVSILSTSSWITIILSIISGIILIIFSKSISLLILKDLNYRFVFVIFGFTVFLYAFNSLFLSIINGFKEFKKYVSISIFSSIIGLIFTTSLVYFWKIDGALIAVVTYQSIVVIITLILLKKTHWFKFSYLFNKFDKFVLKNLSSYTLMAIISTSLVPLNQLLIRSYLTNHLGINSAGIWEGINRLSQIYLTVFSSSLMIFYLPRLSELNDNKLIRKEIFNTFRFLIPILLFLTIIIFLTKSYIIQVLFSKSFYEMKDLFLFQLIGDLFKIMSWILSINMLAKAMSKTFILVEIIFSASIVGFSILFVQYFGIVGTTVAYMLNYILYFILLLFIFRKLLFTN